MFTMDKESLCSLPRLMQKNVQCLLNGTALKAFGKEASAIHLCKDAATEHEWDFLIPQ